MVPKVEWKFDVGYSETSQIWTTALYVRRIDCLLTVGQRIGSFHSTNYQTTVTSQEQNDIRACHPCLIQKNSDEAEVFCEKSECETIKKLTSVSKSVIAKRYSYSSRKVFIT